MLSVLDLGVRARVEVKAKAEAFSVRGVEVLDARVRARNSLERLGVLALVCEVVTGLGASDARSYGLAETVLTLLDQHPEPPRSAVLTGFLAKALSFAGLGAVVDRCAVSGGELVEPVAWAPGLGGAVRVENLPPDFAGASRVGVGELQRVGELLRTPSLQVWEQEGPVELMLGLVEHHLGRGLKARVWIG